MRAGDRDSAADVDVGDHALHGVYLVPYRQPRGLWWVEFFVVVILPCVISGHSGDHDLPGR